MTLNLSDPLKFQNFTRFGFAIFDSEEACLQAKQGLEAQAAKLKFTVGERKSGKRFVRVLPPLHEEKLQNHISLASELIKALDKESGVNAEADVLSNQTGLSPAQLFDLQVLYLRKVHCFCYFSATVRHTANLGIQRRKGHEYQDGVGLHTVSLGNRSSTP